MARRLRIQYSDAIYHVMARVTAGRTSSRTMPTAGGWWLAWNAPLGGRDGRCMPLSSYQSPPPGPQDASPQPRQGNATVPLVVRQWVGSSPPPLRAPLPGPLPDRAGRGRDVSLGPDPLRPSQPRPGRPVRNAGGLDLVELPRLFPPPRSPGLGGLRRVACAWAGEFGRTDPEASYRRFVAAGLTTPPAPPVG